MSHDEFRHALTRVYLDHPCQALANPLWRTFHQLGDYETAVGSDARGINRLEAWQDNALLVYWRRDERHPSLLVNRRLEYQQFAVIHQDFLDAPTVAGFRHFESHYRLIQRPGDAAALDLPPGFRFAGVVDSAAEVEAVAAQIAEGESASLESIQPWLESPNFSSDLWLWVIDTANDRPAGIGIAELDPEHREAALLWVEVMPDYRRRGLGRSVVRELLRRIGRRALFTTVAGPVEDREKPGAFFRQCGFTGSDIWWLLSRA